MSCSFTEGSPREREEPGTQIWDFSDNKFTTTKVKGDFFFYWSLIPDFTRIDTSYVNMKKWIPDIPLREENSFHFTENFILHRNFYDRLDIDVCNGGLVDHFGGYHMYSEKYGIVRSCYYIRGFAVGVDKL